MGVHKGLKWILVALVLGVAIGVALSNVGLSSKFLQVNVSAESSLRTTPSLIITSLPEWHDFQFMAPWTGVVESSAMVQLTALIPGSIEVIEANDQTSIERGSKVMRLGGQTVESKRAQLHAALESLKPQSDLKDQTVQRLQQLLSDRLSTKEQVAAAQEAQIKLHAEFQDAQIALDSFEKQVQIVSPMAGVFTSRRVSQGQTVNAGDIVGEIVDTQNVRVDASLFTPDNVDLNGKAATFHVGGSAKVQGVVTHVLPHANASGATRVWIDVSQNNGRLLPGQTVSGEITLNPSASALAIPESAVIYDAQEMPLVFVKEDDRYVSHPVNLGQIRDGWAQVISGLTQDQYVVTQGGYELFYREFSKQFQVED